MTGWAQFHAAPPEPEKAIRVMYTNWRGETAERHIIPLRMYFGSTDWHPDKQWLIYAHDIDKGETRIFALKDMQPL